MITLLGIDPGSRVTGYGVIQSNGSQHKYMASGCIRTQGENLAERLQQIHLGISEVVRLYQPQEVAIEQVFVDQNPTSALKLGQARGALISAIAVHNIPLAEYTARRVKQSIVGYGGADKHQIQHMVKCLLNLTHKPQADAADALGVAICHAHSRTWRK